VAQPLMAQPKPPSTMSNPLAQVLVLIMILLAVCIAILANVVNNAAALYRDKLREEREKGTATTAAALVALFLLGLPMAAMAQDAAVPAATINGLTPFVFYLLVSVIAIEILIMVALVYQLKFLIGIDAREEAKAAEAAAEATAVAAAAPPKPKEGWWWRFNKAADISQEQDIDLSHDYDGISELDNKLPPWWTVAFGITILFSVVYLYRYHVAHTAPLQIEELQIAIKKGEAEKAAYLAKNAANVDENTVTMLDAAGIASGKNLFAANCIACHGNAGEGNAVGPNLTDEYWLNGGSINDIFRTIKYGVTEKGMRSWKDDMSPMQMAQLASYIKSLQGTNPANAKEPQGEKYEEKAAEPADGETPADAAAGA
ncbi:MAG TPA: cbb3-type cytochrome c oxidase N-terminal domain-containing protein, partial [Phnomibacter sp.]|nr:cbb3-type cytochrome c oxidase N-terminal domain-containing protein [Phnomibacter sp.]